MAQLLADQQLADRLTILTTLYGRPEFTLRHLLYLEAVRCPFKIFFADGSHDDQNRTIIENNRHRFPHVQYAYHRYPPDKGWLDYLRKILDALNDITTPYVVLWDNDDFYSIPALFKCIHFLDADTQCSYVGCMGSLYALTTKNDHIFAPITSVLNIDFGKQFMADAVAERFCLVDNETIHAVFRCTNMKSSLCHCLKSNISDWPLFFYLYKIIAGKVACLPTALGYKHINHTTWKDPYLFDTFSTTDTIEKSRHDVSCIIKRIGLSGSAAKELQDRILITVYGVKNPKTFREFVNFNAHLYTRVWERFVRFYHHLNIIRYLPQTLRWYRSNDETVAVIKRILSRKNGA